MSANASAVYGIYASTVALNDVLRALNESGFEKEDMCIMLSPTHPIAATVRESGGRSFERVASERAAGLIAWLSEFGAVVIPTFGFFIRSRRFFHALMLEHGSVGGCGGNGTLASLGFPKKDAEHFESHVREVGALVYMPCHQTEKTKSALELLRATGANEAGLLENESVVGTAV